MLSLMGFLLLFSGLTNGGESDDVQISPIGEMVSIKRWLLSLKLESGHIDYPLPLANPSEHHYAAVIQPPDGYILCGSNIVSYSESSDFGSGGYSLDHPLSADVYSLSVYAASGPWYKNTGTTVRVVVEIVAVKPENARIDSAGPLNTKFILRQVSERQVSCPRNTFGRGTPERRYIDITREDNIGRFWVNGYFILHKIQDGPPNLNIPSGVRTGEGRGM
jgi:hypothetical protein